MLGAAPRARTPFVRAALKRIEANRVVEVLTRVSGIAGVQEEAAAKREESTPVLGRRQRFGRVGDGTIEVRRVRTRYRAELECALSVALKSDGFRCRFDRATEVP